MGFWSKAKGLFGRIGRGIKKVAGKAYNVVKGAVEKFGPAIGAAVSTAVTGDPTIGAKIGKAAQGIAGFLPTVQTSG